MKKTLLFVIIVLCLLTGVLSAEQPNPPGQVKPGAKPEHEAYLFAHMMEGDYWRLYYSVSLDGLYWRPLNGAKRVFEEYRGHADICKGHDGRYYLVGNRGDDRPDINFWVSDDLITWTRYSDYVPDLKSIPNYSKALPRIGAPKVYFDRAGSQYLLTWHTTHDLGKTTHDLGKTTLPEPYWAGQRTIYATSKDLRTFSEPPKRLFDMEMATIDTLVRRVGDRYYAIIKDELYPSIEWPTGKTIRICFGPTLLGPWSKPGPSLSPNFREAPTLIPSPDGKFWYLYYEQYPGVSYGLSVAERLEGPWFQVSGATTYKHWNKYEVTPKSRHGCMIPISQVEYDALVDAFPADR